MCTPSSASRGAPQKKVSKAWPEHVVRSHRDPHSGEGMHGSDSGMVSPRAWLGAGSPLLATSVKWVCVAECSAGFVGLGSG